MASIVLETAPWVGHRCKARSLTVSFYHAVRLCLIFAGVRQDGLCTGPRSKWDRLALSESQMTQDTFTNYS